MTRTDGLDDVLRPWMARNAPPAPSDLLLRVMREVDTMEQKSAPRQVWHLGLRPMLAVAATAVVAVLVVAVGLALTNYLSTPAGKPAFTDWAADPTGDGDPDIVAVSTSLIGDELIFEVEFAEPYLTETSELYIGLADPHNLSWSGCALMYDEYGIEMVKSGPPVLSQRVDPHVIGRQDVGQLDSDVAGRLVTITVPLVLIGDPEVLHLGVWANLADELNNQPDTFPGHSECRTIEVP